MKLTADNLVVTCFHNNISVPHTMNWLQALGFMANEQALEQAFEFMSGEERPSDLLDLHELL